MRATVIASMRNEGPFIVEWVCWYTLLGFSDLVVVTNDCTDYSPQLLDALQRAGWLVHMRCDVPAGGKVVAEKLRMARKTPQVRRADWVLVCDVDEFLVVHDGQGKLPDLLGPNPDFLAMAINWRVFGTGGQTKWQDGFTHRQFTQAGPTAHWISSWIKMIHRDPTGFRALGEHGPRKADPALAGRASCGALLVNSDLVPVPGWPDGPYLRQLPAHLVTHRRAQMNHYMLRSEESWSLKRGTPSAVQGADRYNDRYYRSTNRNELTDQSALRHQAEFDALFATAMSLPEVARLHHLCCADYVTHLALKAGRNPQDDPRLSHHLAAAAR